MAKLVVGVNDLGTVNPELAAEWHPTKNGSLTVQDVTSGSSKKVWFKCAADHEWEATITRRSNGNGCPACSVKDTLAGFNDLATVNPKLVAEWHPTKNEELAPQEVTSDSVKKVWWICESSHEWEAPINLRSNGNGCPSCSGKNVIAGFNDLVTIRSEIAAEWHPTVNGKITPQDVTATFSKKVVW